MWKPLESALLPACSEHSGPNTVKRGVCVCVCVWLGVLHRNFFVLSTLLSHKSCVKSLLQRLNDERLWHQIIFESQQKSFCPFLFFPAFSGYAVFSSGLIPSPMNGFNVDGGGDAQMAVWLESVWFVWFTQLHVTLLNSLPELMLILTIPTNWYSDPVLGVSVFLPRNFLDFWHLGNYSWQNSQDFARFFKIVEVNPRKFLDFFARKPRISKILAGEPRKILDFLPIKILDFWDFLPRSIHEINENNGLNFLRQNVWFFRPFSGIHINRFCVGENLVQASSTECQKPRSIKNYVLQILLSEKWNWRFSHVFLRSKDDSNHWNKNSNK